MTSYRLTPYERETVVNIGWGDEVAHVETFRQRDMTKLRNVLDRHPEHSLLLADATLPFRRMEAAIPSECVTLRPPRNLGRIAPLVGDASEEGFGNCLGWGAGSALTRDEMETRYLLNDEWSWVHVYSDHPTVVKMVLRLAAAHPDHVQCVSAENEWGQVQVEARLVREFFSIRPSRATRLAEGVEPGEHLDEGDEGSLGVSG